mgnify:CR=1 FL=1
MPYIKKTGFFRLEFIRYAFVGGIATIADFAALFLFREFILKDIPFSLYISNALGFTAGITVNYFLSLSFVFASAADKKTGRSIRDITVFAVVGIVGLFLSEIGMFIGVSVFELYYMFVKVIVTLIVLIWNYLARKVLIFDKKSPEGPGGYNGKL